LHVGKPLPSKPLRDTKTAPAVVTVNDDSLFGEFAHFVDTLLNLAHRNQGRTLDFRRLVLVGLAAIEQNDGRIVAEQLGGLFNGYFYW
jgi:hypothetical protein